MAVINPIPVNFKDATLKIGANNYETSVSAITLTPTYPETEFNGIGGNSISALGIPTWVCDISYPQDWATANALSTYLFANQGTTQVVDLVPKSGGAGFRFSVVVKAGPIGGTVNELLAGSVQLKVSGQPVTPIPGA